MIKDQTLYNRYYSELSNITDSTILIQYAAEMVRRFRTTIFWDEQSRLQNSCYLAAVFKRLGEQIEISDLKNLSTIHNFCELLKYKDMVFGVANVDKATIDDSLLLLNEKVREFIKNKIKIVGLDIQEQQLEPLEKILYLIVTDSLTKDTYLLAKDNKMEIGNFAVMISTYKAAENQYQELIKDKLDNQGKARIMLLPLIWFCAGNTKLQNQENLEAIKAIYRYLLGNGITTDEIIYLIPGFLRTTYEATNPYEDEIKMQISSSQSVTFKRRKRYSQDSFYEVIPQIVTIIEELPIELQMMIEEIRFDDEKNPQDFMWEKEYNTQDFHSVATCDYENKVIYFYSRMWKAKIIPDKYTLAHEAAHAYDCHCAKDWGVTSGLISDSSMWYEAMKKDEEFNSLTGVSEYARTSKSAKEDFADSIAYFVVCPQILDCFPNRKKLLEEHFTIYRKPNYMNK